MPASQALTAAETTAGWVSGGATDVWGEAATPYNIYYNRVPITAVKQQPESVFIAAEWYGTTCMAPNTYPKDPVTNYPLMLTAGAGCANAADPMSLVADK